MYLKKKFHNIAIDNPSDRTVSEDKTKREGNLLLFMIM